MSETSLISNPEIPDLYASINESDRQWLDTLGLKWDSEENSSERFAALHDVVVRGSVHIDPGMDEASVADIMDVREHFFALCTNISAEAVDDLRALNRTLVPLDTVVATQRLLTAEGINNLIVNDQPRLLARGPKGLTTTIAYLKNLGVDIPEATQKFPAILTYSDEGLSEKISALDLLGDDLVTVINREPSILALGSATIQKRISHLNQSGLNASKAIIHLPTLLQLPPNTIDTKLDELKKIGVGVGVLNASPVILGYAVESVAQKIYNLKTLGLDTSKVITSLPECLSYAVQSVRDKFNNITRLGLDAAKVINKHPDILYYPQDAISAKVANLLRLGISLKAIERGPALINFGEETVKVKLADITDLGLNAKKVVNSHPAVLNLSQDNIQQKLDELTQLGLDARKVIDAKPGILALTPETVRNKLLLLESASRAWGWQDAREHIVRIVQEWPLILTYSPGKLRTLIRIASETFEPIAAESVSKTQVSGLVKNNLEESVVAYLNHRKEVSAPKDIVRIAKAYKHLEKLALRDIILGHADDSVAKMYRKSYP